MNHVDVTVSKVDVDLFTNGNEQVLKVAFIVKIPLERRHEIQPIMMAAQEEGVFLRLSIPDKEIDKIPVQNLPVTMRTESEQRRKCAADPEVGTW